MWYVAWDWEGLERHYGPGGETPRVAYAESQDGVHWEKPSLGMVEYRGSRDNNLVGLEAPVVWPSVLYEPDEPNPERRYKMICKGYGGPRMKGYLDRFPEWQKAILEEGVDVTVSPLYAHSADGFRWQLAEHNPLLHRNLEGTNFFRFGGHYFVQGHAITQWAPTTAFLLNGDQMGRTLLTYKSPDLVHWSEGPALSFLRHGYRSAPQGTVEETHTINGAWSRDDLVLSAYGQWHGSTEIHARSMDLGLLVSNDGLYFREPIADFRLLSRGDPGSWDGGSLWGVSFLNRGEKTYLYYGGGEGGGSTLIATHQIGLATLDRDRFGYLSPRLPQSEGVLTSSPLEIRDKVHVFVNAEGLGPESQLRFALLDEAYQPIPAYSVADSRPLENDGLRQPVSWQKHEAVEGVEGKRLLLQVRFLGKGQNSPRLYAVYLTTN